MTRNLREIQCGKITRKSFGKIKEAIDIPYLVEIQKDSYDSFVAEGISEVLEDFSPITDFADRFELYFLDHWFESKGKYTEKECRDRSATFSVPLSVRVRLINKETGEHMDDDVFMGDFPKMTENGSFIINGAERVVVSQLVRSPGVYNSKTVDKTGKNLFGTQVIPSRGAWLEFEQDSQGILWVHVDRTRKITATVLLRALGYGSNDALTTLFANDPMIADTIAKDKDDARSERDGLMELYKRLRPDDICTEEGARIYIRNTFFDPKRYDLARVGRYKFNKKLKMSARAVGLTAYENIANEDGEVIVMAGDVITKEQAVAIQNAGINEIFVAIGDEKHKIIANNVVDFEAVTGMNPRKFGLLDTVYYPALKFARAIADELKSSTVEDISEKYKKEINEYFYLFEKFNLSAENEKPEDRKNSLKNKEIRVKFVEACQAFYALIDAKQDFKADADLRKTLRPLIDKLNHKHITVDDIVASVSNNLDLNFGIGTDDNIDHLANRRVKSVGELLQNQFRIGVTRLEKVIKERMSTQNSAEITPKSLINVRPVSAAIKEFFGSSQLSQFMDQTNPIAELTHKRKLSALGPGGLSRDRASNEVRDINHTHYGRMCPIETPEGQNIGLINSLTAYAKINEFGFIESAYRKVIRDDEGRPVVTDTVEYLAADEEDNYTVAQANEALDEQGHFINERVSCRRREDITEAPREEIDYMDVSPKQVISVATALIPFLENDDTNRALMGSNMQRQAVPLLTPENAIVATGIEGKIAYDSGVMVTAKEGGVVKSVASDLIVITEDDGNERSYVLKKFERSNNGTCLNQKPLVDVGERISKGDVIADGPATKNGELALGKNILIGFQSWEGYNYEDAILLSEKLVREDAFTSIHIEEKKVSARDTKLGEEEITREIPNLNEEALKNLDEDGIVRVGTEVKPNDILVGKVTPKGEQEATPEVRLLRAILGNNERDVKDTSERVKNGEGGIVVDVKVFDRSKKDELPPGVNKEVRVYIAQKRKISIGDKMAGRHGNKGIVSRILPEADMPFMADGTPLQIVLNPLGVPSRMNIGQVLEVHLGLACKQLGWKIATPVFDGAKEEDIKELLAKNYILNPDGEVDGKIQLYDGRTGEPFENRATVGQMYMIKLHHLVDDKMHARSTGPYSMVTQQPLGGKAQKGGQRFGEMEVWALEAYGAAHILQEILTVKSDDMYGRDKTYQSIVHGQNIGEPGIPESFKVLMKELQSLALDMKVLTDNNEELTLKYLDDNDEIETPRFKGEVGVIEVPTDAEIDSYDVPDIDTGDFDFMSKELFGDDDDTIDTTVPTDDDFAFDDDLFSDEDFAKDLLDDDDILD
ncbi:MAG: DNA-directed RNA polymerase subunit beta [Clostridia bacterium]|nr:DNA-directed RNA polymerase subunit beta [Clostridia bacterium]